MADESIREMTLMPGPFGDLRHSPFEVDLGTEEVDSSAVDADGLRIRLGDRPMAKNLRVLYRAAHHEMPADGSVFDAYDVWLITHTAGVIRRTGGAAVEALGYEADFADATQIYTVDLLPQIRFSTLADTGWETCVDIGAGGEAREPEDAIQLLASTQHLGGGAMLNPSVDVALIGRVNFPLLTPTMQTVGKGASRCQWYFERDREPLLGEQTMLQTVLMPKFAVPSEFRVRAYVMIKSRWLKSPARFNTEWVNVECWVA